MITIIVDDPENDIYYKQTALTFTQAEMEIYRLERNYIEELKRQKEELKDDHIAGEVAEQEEQEHKECLSKTNQCQF